jgi:carbamoyltransferase
MIIVGLYGAYDWHSNNTSLEINNATFVHDGGCSLFIDGKHICSINEERLTRIKYDGNYPSNSIDYCLSAASIKKEDVDIVCSVAAHHEIALFQLETGVAESILRKSFPNAEIRFVGHHLSHAASAVFTSPFNEGSFLTFDGGGSPIHDPYRRYIDHIENNSIGFFNKEKRIFRFYNMPENHYNNFGQLYSAASAQIYAVKTGKAISNWIDQVGAVGKIMGLSAYGNDIEYSDAFIVTEHSIPYINFKNTWFDEHPFTAEDASHWLQKSFENGMIALLKKLRRHHLDENVCFAGGTFLNILANTKIKQSGIFDNIHIPPFTDDSGIHLGAALWGCFEEGEDISFPDNTALLGKEYSDQEILEAIELFELKYQSYDSDIVAQKISDNKIIGWFQGRSEHGPRALGSRSIFMSPTKAENKDVLNKRVKHREYWRPFAGIIQEDKVSEYFNEGFITPHMLFTQTVKTDQLPAITHNDGTCRIQTLNEKDNPKVYELLSKLDPPVVVNTSFNDNGQPIVETPYHAVKSFLKMDIDYLVIGDYIVTK